MYDEVKIYNNPLTTVHTVCDARQGYWLKNDTRLQKVA